MKTVRNCIFNSGDGARSRHMWKDSKNITWGHFRAIYESQKVNHLKHAVPKLKYDHINLTSFAKMKVFLAVQVLSNTMSKALVENGTDREKESRSETSKVCGMMNSFFDCCNVRNNDEGRNSRNAFKEPYTDVNDERFVWLKKDFLEFFRSWEKSVQSRPGEFTKGERGKMFISKQSMDGLKITVNSLIEAVQFLLKNGMPFVLTEKFCQDALEEYFGCQRAIGRRSDNPDLRMFGYNGNSLRNQKYTCCTTGNTISSVNVKRKWHGPISHDSLNKRKSIQ